MQQSIHTVAFVWQGKLGAALASRLARAGYVVRGFAYTEDQEPAEQAPGTVACATIAEAAAGAEAVVTLLASPQAAEDVYLGSGGVLEVVGEHTYLVDLTISNPRQARELHALAAVHDCYYVDAPVDGVAGDDVALELRVFAGGEGDTLAVVRPVLEALSSHVVDMGLPGCGAAAKVAAVVSRASELMGLVETLAFMQYSQVSKASMLAYVEDSPLLTNEARHYARLILDEDYGTGSDLAELLAELTVALDAADELGMAFPLLETAHQLYDLLALVGGGGMAPQALALIYRDEAFCRERGLDWELAQKAMDVYDHAIASQDELDDDFDDYDDFDDCDSDYDDYDDEDADNGAGDAAQHHHHHGHWPHDGGPPLMGGYFSAN
jgi:3-hydroxyisobutyrate dehydrogenase